MNLENNGSFIKINTPQPSQCYVDTDYTQKLQLDDNQQQSRQSMNPVSNDTQQEQQLRQSNNLERILQNDYYENIIQNRQ